MIKKIIKRELEGQRKMLQGGAVLGPLLPAPGFLHFSSFFIFFIPFEPSLCFYQRLMGASLFKIHKSNSSPINNR
jgi:hypothetical protein